MIWKQRTTYLNILLLWLINSNFSSFESRRVQIEHQKNSHNWRKERDFDILFLNITNEPKVVCKDVTCPYIEGWDYIFFFALKNLCYSEDKICYNKIIIKQRNYTLDLHVSKPYSLGWEVDLLGRVYVKLKVFSFQICCSEV